MRFPLLRALLLALCCAVAQANDAAWLRCAALKDGAERLACYDAQAAQVQRARPAAAAVPAQPAAPAAPDSNFGVEVRREAQQQSIESHLPGAFNGWSAGTVFVLANGQRWTVVDGSSAVLWLKDPKTTIRRALLGGFRIEFEGTNQTARVRRLD
jgi:hypothetical protein